MINLDLEHYIQSVDNLRNLIRYQTAPRVSRESVAEHSFFVAAYVLKLHDYYDFNLQKALSIALLHDFAETEISDVPHPVKRAYPLIELELDKAEYDVNKNAIGQWLANGVDEFNHMTSPEGIIVKLADVLSVVAYSKYEIELGNSHYMRTVYEGTIDRYKECFQKAQAFARPNMSCDLVSQVEKFINS